MFWRIQTLSATSPVEAILDREGFSLEELLDEEEIIQECKTLNNRLINFLRGRAQIEQLLRYIVEEAPADGDSKRVFKFPFIACEIFTCEVDIILRALVEDEELMDLLFSFLQPNRPHSSLLAGYFSKVVICLMLRKTASLTNYVRVHEDIFCRLVDLIGITSIMEVLVRLVGADDHMFPNFVDVMQWLADSNLLEMIVDKLSSSSPPEVHANAAEVLWAITQNAPSPLTSKLYSESFISRILGHALDEPLSKSSLVHSLAVCICLLDPKRSVSTALVHSIRSHHLYDPPIPINPETVNAMLPRLGDLLTLLNVSSDESILPTGYGELRPPLGKHRLKIVEFMCALLGTGDEVAEKELVNSGAIQRILSLFFEYPFHNELHHHVERIIISCLESKNSVVVSHLLEECNLVEKLLQADTQPLLSGDLHQPTLPAPGRKSPRAGYIGHITRIANKLVQLENSNYYVHAHLQEKGEWVNWQTNNLQERNTVENVYRWACGRPTALHERTHDSDEDELRDKDYDVAHLADDMNRAFRYSIYENEDAGEDTYFDDETAEVVISSLRLGDDQESLFTNSNWFAFQEDRIRDGPLSTSSVDEMDDVNLNETTIGVGSSSSGSDDEVVVGEDESAGNEIHTNGPPGSSEFAKNITISTLRSEEDEHPIGSSKLERANVSADDLDFFRCDVIESDDLFSDRQLPDWVGWKEPSDIQVDGSDDAFEDSVQLDMDPVIPPTVASPTEAIPQCDNTSGPAGEQCTIPPLFEEDVEFIGVDLEGMEKAMERALKEGIVEDLGVLNKESSGEDVKGILEFNDNSYWRVEHEVGVVQE
ncbi:hypothetical protein QJS10_CPB18g02107 [Acorus calamus]|uniref:SIT4 phosphatase-associated family protein n=1 Tax=Acorus calamus TaxID=4465 RepID=A0AAV9CQE5_ACOCL|nr:hypothetical protein QJS10_CPB18g02107 [Acorus calamus]